MSELGRQGDDFGGRSVVERQGVGYRFPEVPPETQPPWYRRAFGYVGSSDIPWAGFGWVLFAAVLYSALIFVKSPDNFWEWLSTFVATILSVLAAVALYRHRHQTNRAEMENLYKLHTTLDADLESILYRLDTSRVDRKPLSIHLPTGETASAHVSMGEDRVPVFEELAKAGLPYRRGAFVCFNLASAVRAYAEASSTFVSLYHMASTAPHIGPNTAQALVHAAETMEKMRKGLIEECEEMRKGVQKWLDEHQEFNPWGSEHDDPFVPPRTTQQVAGQVSIEQSGPEQVDPPQWQLSLRESVLEKARDYEHHYENG